MKWSALCFSSDAAQSTPWGTDAVPGTLVQEQPVKLPAELREEASAQGNCTAVWSCCVQEAAACGLQTLVELVQFGEQLWVELGNKWVS